MVFRIINQNWLVVSIPLKNMKVSWDDYSQYMGKKTCSKPPTSISRLFWCSTADCMDIFSNEKKRGSAGSAPHLAKLV
jgi:hypothetical protein